MSGWGPQPTAIAAPRLPGKKGGAYWLVYLGCVIAGIPLFFLAFIAGPIQVASCQRLYRPEGQAVIDANCDSDVAMTHGAQLACLAIIVVTMIGGVILGIREARRNVGFAHGRTLSAVIVAMVAFPSFLAYAIAYGIGRATARRHEKKKARKAEKTNAQVAQRGYRHVLTANDPLASLDVLASTPFGVAGGHVGWTDEGDYISARPRGGMLVIGPPGSGKTSAVIIPSVIVAPGACVASSIKGDVMQATAAIRARRGAVWHFDPGGQEQPAPGVQQARWSPLVEIHSWDDARMIAGRLAEPMRTQHGNKGGGGDAHFVDRARDWVEVLLYAAHLAHAPISVVADWAQTADSDETGQTVLIHLIAAEQDGEDGARIARLQLEGLMTTPDRERGSIRSTMAGLLRIYGSTSARAMGDNPNFDPRAFVRSTDTLYITATPERQHEYAPLIAGLLEAIRFATYARHRAEEEGREPKRPHVTFVLDEANNTAPIPLPAIISEAGGQSLHLIVGIQDLSRARARWDKEADGFLTLFPTKLILAGVVEPYTLDALSSAAGKYDRLMVGYSESTSYVGHYSMPVRQINPSYSIQREDVLTQGDIANLPYGKGLFWQGAQWVLVNVGMHWQHPAWRRVIEQPTPMQ